MPVLVTGGGGFVGSHLVEELVRRDVDVTVADKFGRGTRDNLTAVEDDERVRIVEVDLCDAEKTRELVSSHERVYHLAALIGGVGYLRDCPAEIISTNDLINKNVFDACVDADVDKVVFAGSSMVYARAETFPTGEGLVDEIPPPDGSYGFQKLNSEVYCRSYARQYGLEYSIGRIFNGVGPRDWPAEEVGHGHVVPDLVRKIVELERNPLPIKGSGEQTRCFTDVRDIAEGLILCMESDAGSGEAFNLGTMQETSISELAQTIWEVSGNEGTLELEREDPFARDVQRRVPDNTKAKELLGWEPEYSLEEMLDRYVTAYRERYI